MTQERTATTDDAMTATTATELRRGGAAAEAPPAPEERPLDTRALRDAQSAPPPQPAPASRPPIQAENAHAAPDIDAPLFASEAADQLRERWITIQTEFVDSPREAVEKADSLVAETLKQLTETFARERDQLEAGWSTTGNARASDESVEAAASAASSEAAEPSTEDLRQAIRRYRSFFNRLLSV